MHDLNDLAIFVRLADLLSFEGAARDDAVPEVDHLAVINGTTARDLESAFGSASD